MNAGVSPTTVLDLEAGKVSEAQRRTNCKLAEALGVDPAEFVGADQSTTSSILSLCTPHGLCWQGIYKAFLVFIQRAIYNIRNVPRRRCAWNRCGGYESRGD
jgi:transcriptional regulator with XRE-family HTH domain